MDEAHAAEPAGKPGRPSLYTPELAAKICARLADGESLRRICRDDGMPDRSTVLRWLDANEGFRGQYARARELQADALAEDAVDIADYGVNDTTVDSEGNRRVDHDVIQRSRLRYDARRWYASKLAPKKYGEKLQLDGNVTHDISSISNEDLARALLDRAATGGSAPSSDQG